MLFRCYIILSIIVGFTSLCSAQTNLSLVENIASTAVEETTRKGAHLIDVRTDNEYAKGHIAGAKQINISNQDFVERINKLDKTKPIILYCAVGVRSSAAVDKIRNLGFPVIYNFIGGIREWKKNKLPLEKPD